MSDAPAPFKTTETLWPAIRQFRHNSDNSPDILKPRDGFVMAYDMKIVDELVTGLQAENERLKAGYREAIEDIESWAGYASIYFQDKHGLSDCLQKHRATVENSDE